MKLYLPAFVFLICIHFQALAQSVIQTQLGSAITFVVAKDGSGQYSTVQAAVNALPNNSTTPKLIFIKKGTYTEKVEIPATKTNLFLIGEEASSTIIAYGDYTGSGKIYNGIVTSANGQAIGTSTSHTLYVAANDFTMMNLTIKNTAGDVGQAVALNSNGDRHFLYHCKLIGYQDTYYTWNNGRFYLKDTYIEGAIDYIFGRGVALFDSCQLHSVRSSSYITAGATDQNFKFGYVFNNCKLTAPAGISSVFLGRPWKAYCQVVFMNSEEGSFLSPAGWSAWSGTTNDQTCYYAEYKNCGAGSSISKRVSWSRQLTAAQAATYSKTNLFTKNVNPAGYTSEWNPDPESNTFYKIIKRNTTRLITSACFSAVPTDCNGTPNGTAKQDNCGRCVDGTTGKTACNSVGEIETDACDFNGVMETTNTGFKGNSYVNGTNSVGSFISLNILAANAGQVILSFRYANGGTSDRSSQLSVNGATLSTKLNFPVTGDYTEWKTVDLTLDLIKGINTVKLISTTAEGLPNLDQLGYVSSGIGKGTCVITSLEESSGNQPNFVYPNPFTSQFHLKSQGAFSFSVSDVTGTIVEKGTAEKEILLGEKYPSGIYFVHLQHPEYLRVYSIVKQ